MIDAVLEFSRLDIHRIYFLEANEFFTYVDYVRAREKKKADAIRAIQMR